MSIARGRHPKRGQRTPTVDLSRVPEDVWCVGVGFGLAEYALRAFTCSAVERVRGMTWWGARARLEEETEAVLEDLKAAERVATEDIGILTLICLHASLVRI